MREYGGHITGEEVAVGWALIRTDDGRLPKRVMFGKIKDGVKKGQGRQEQKWTTCVENDVRSFKIQHNWKHAVRDTQSWTEIVTEGGRGFMTEWRKEKEEKFKPARRRGRPNSARTLYERDRVG